MWGGVWLAVPPQYVILWGGIYIWGSASWGGYAPKEATPTYRNAT